MIYPTVHLNGTSKRDLIDELDTAVMHVTDAIEALKRTVPNARDYYPQGPNVIQQAIAEHVDRVNRLTSVRDDLMQIWQHIVEGK